MSAVDTAYVMGRVMEMIAKEVPKERRRAVAKQIWKLCDGIDFNESEMECDKALLSMGLAVDKPDPDYPGETVTEYKL
jgi:hypothetical protein